MGRRYFRANKDSIDMIRWRNTGNAYGEQPRRLYPFERNGLHTGHLLPVYPSKHFFDFDEYT